MKTLFLALALVVATAAPSMALEFSGTPPALSGPVKSSGSRPRDPFLSQEMRALSMRRPHFFAVRSTSGNITVRRRAAAKRRKRTSARPAPLAC